MTLKEALDSGKQLLEKVRIQESALDAWYLLEYVTRVSRAEYFGDSNRELSKDQEELYFELINQRSTRKPLQHITGIQEFMGLIFQVNEHVLIPRQDTEVLVETALECIREGDSILDMCTGSGCILISLLKLKDGINGMGIDISKEALAVAKLNGVFNEVSPDWVESDLFEKIEDKFDIIVSNPPYIATEEIKKLEEEVKIYDPMLALDGKEDGMYFYKKIIQEAKLYLKSDGTLLFEIGHDQGELVSEYMKMHGFYDVQIKKDLAGLDRVVYGRVK